MKTGMPDLFPYQETGRDFLVQNRVAFLADQPGLGKTPQAIMAAQKVGNPGTKVCVICPKSAVENWRREMSRWWPNKSILSDLVINYDALIVDGNPAQKTFLETQWDVIIIDEAHRLKTSGALRSKVVYRQIARLLMKKPDLRVWLLSGTPAKNHVGELWTHLVILRPDLILDRSGRPMTEEQFQTKFCRVGHDAHGHRRIYGSRNIKELRDILETGGFLLRRRKKDVQKWLPPLIFDDYPLSSGSGTPDNLRPSPLEDFGVMNDDQILEYLKNNSSSLAEWRHRVAEFKTPLVKDFLETELENPGEKIILFFHHTILGRELYRLMAQYEPVIVDGKTKNAQAEVDEFQNNPNCRLFFGQIATCQEAMNITAATQVAFAESAWSPTDNYQAACRAHRHGLEGTLLVRFLSLANTPDDIVQRVVARKSVELAELFD